MCSILDRIICLCPNVIQVKIRKNALICNVLYGVNITVNEQDVVINKDYFRDVYCYFSFDKSEKEFYEKDYL